MGDPCATTETGKRSSWISRALSDENGVPSASRLFLAVAVGFALGLATGALCAQQILTSDIRELVETVLWVCAGAYGIPRAVAAGVAK
jgi:hypothetical protein